MNRRRFTPGSTAEVALAVLSCAAAVLVYQGFFATNGYLPALMSACLTGAVTAVAGHRRTWTTVALGAVGLALVMVYGVFGGAASAIFGGLRGSWNRLLTVTAPADTWPELLAAPALVTWAGAFSSVLLVLWTRHPLAPLAPSLAAFLFSLLVVGDQTGGHPAATAIFLLAALLLIAVRTHRGSAAGAGRPSGRPVVALALVAAMVAASALFGVAGGRTLPLASGDHRFDLRDVLAPPVLNTDTLTPLAELKKQLNENPTRPLFTVRTDPATAARLDRIRTAALDTFDGTTWTANDTYRVAGSRLAVDPELVRRKQLKVRVELQELTGPYLPVIGWPSSLDARGETGGRFGFDPDSGVLVRTGPTSPGFGYDLTAETYLHDSDLAKATPVRTGSPLLPDGMPEALRTLASEVTKELPSTRPRDRLSYLEAGLRVMPYRMDRPPGHSYAALARVVASGKAGGGYAEQYAAVFAVIARMWGFPARVAVGYRLAKPQDGVFHVTTADAHAWPEVHFAGYGWIGYDPTGTGQMNEPRETRVEPPRVVPPQPAPPSTAPELAPPAETQAAGAPDEWAFRWSDVLNGTFMVVPSTVLLLLTAGGLVVLGKALRRKRRRGDPDHAARVLGAWHEQLDRLTERGISPPVSLTFHEVAQHVRGSLGDVANPITATAELATAAIYAPEHVDRQKADQAWAQVGRLNAGLYPARVSAARVRAAVNPVPLWSSWAAARRRRLAAESLETGRYR